MKVSIRKFEKRDVPQKIEWINNPANHRYLHYELPLEYDKTLQWFERNQNRTDRYDAVIECDGVSVGLIGLLSIDAGQAEYYISMGDTSFKGKGVAFEASLLLLDYAFRQLKLDKVYLMTETGNLAAQRLFSRLGFVIEDTLKNNIISHGKYADRYLYGLLRSDYLDSRFQTPLYSAGEWNGNCLYIKREDLLPFSFGGNKARKAFLFFERIDRQGSDCVVTYGSSSSNHCRVVANMCAQRGIGCVIISPEEASEPTFNSLLMKQFGAEIICVPVAKVSETIDNTLDSLRQQGKRPFFIPGGGHGNVGTHAYRLCYDEIKAYERENDVFFDYIFFASGTGTTQAGLVSGQLLHRDERQIIGISIARKNPYGRDVVLQSIRDYLPCFGEDMLQANTHFTDCYVRDGYGKGSEDTGSTIKRVMARYGIPMDVTYTGKAFDGMAHFLAENAVRGKNILFIHTGGTPLFFDYLRGNAT